MSSDKQKIEELLREWKRRSEEGDLDGLLALTADDAVFLTPGNPPISKSDFAKGFRQFTAKAHIEVRQDVKELQVSGAMAFAWSHLDVAITTKAEGKRTQSSGYVLTVFRKGPDGEWRLARDANLTAGAGNPGRV